MKMCQQRLVSHVGVFLRLEQQPCGLKEKQGQTRTTTWLTRRDAAVLRFRNNGTKKSGAKTQRTVALLLHHSALACIILFGVFSFEEKVTFCFVFYAFIPHYVRYNKRINTDERKATD